ncbi:MAG TPA: VgrG-related protein [Candidatus Limnocylindrales bacterium]|jgi:uncharacterized protein involved in type VI secretion and phage assembly
MPATTSATQYTIEIEGSELADDVKAQVESVLVVDRMAMPDTFTVVFRDPDCNVVGRAGIEVGNAVKISAALTEDSAEPLITGEVTSIEADYDALGTRAVVRGYDRSHRLAAGRKTATFQNVKYSDIASQIASDAGLSADCDDSGTAVDHVMQANQSDLDFLYALAREIGFECRVDDETLLFKNPAETSGAPSAGDFDSEDAKALVWKHNLIEFRGRMSAVAQVTDVQVRGWDPKEKAVVIGQADASATNAKISMSPGDLADKVGGESMTVVNHPVAAQDPADALAKARVEQVGSAAFEATAVVTGSPTLKAGTAVSISGVDPALEGDWVISGTRHEFGGSSYKTHLEFNGRQDRSFSGLVTQGGGQSDRFFGVVIGVVTDNDDPDQFGRVKVKYPWLADDAESWWARVMAPGAGKDYGVIWLPQVGDEVLVAFEHGDTNFPFVLGGLWNGKDTIPFDYGAGLDNGSVTTCGFVSRKGHKVTFTESSSESSIVLDTEGSAVTITLDEQNKVLEIKTSGKVTINADQDIEIKAGGSMKLEATGQMTIKGATVAIN